MSGFSWLARGEREKWSSWACFVKTQPKCAEVCLCTRPPRFSLSGDNSIVGEEELSGACTKLLLYSYQTVPWLLKPVKKDVRNYEITLVIQGLQGFETTL
jgi:hypothetical protein